MKEQVREIQEMMKILSGCDAVVNISVHKVSRRKAAEVTHAVADEFGTPVEQKAYEDTQWYSTAAANFSFTAFYGG